MRTSRWGRVAAVMLCFTALLGPSGIGNASEDSEDFYVIKTLLIEGTEAPALDVFVELDTVQTMLEAAQAEVLEASRDAAEVEAFPYAQRTVRLSDEGGEIDSQQILEQVSTALQGATGPIQVGRDSLAAEQANVEAAQADLDAAFEGNQQQRDEIDAILNELAAVGSNLSATRMGLSATAVGIDNALESAQAATTATSSASYSTNVSDLQQAVQSASDELIGSLDLSGISQTLASAVQLIEALAGEVTVDEGATLAAVQQVLADVAAAVNGLGDPSAEAMALVSAAVTDTQILVDAQVDESSARLAEEYRASVLHAQTSLGEAQLSADAVIASTQESVGDLVTAVKAAGEAIVNDSAVTVDVQAILATLNAAVTDLQTTLAFTDTIQTNMTEAAAAVAKIAVSDVDLQGVVVDASIDSFDALFWALIIGDETRLREAFGTTHGVVLTSRARLATVGDGVDGAIRAADTYAGWAEAPADEADSGTPADGDGGAIRSDCDVATYDGVHIYTGDGQGQTCVGTSGPDIFHMRGHNDTAYGRGGSDQVHMGEGDDNGHGEYGTDHVWGGEGNDTIYGGYGDDVVKDNAGNFTDSDWLYGGPGYDIAEMRDGDTQDAFWGGDGRDDATEYDKNCGPTMQGWVCDEDHVELD